MSQTKDTTELADDAVVWRFMDLWKFLHMLEKRSLYLTRIDKLEDPYDGQLHPDQHDLAKQRIVDALDGQPGQAKFSQKADALIRQGCTDEFGPAFVSCWYLGNNSSYAMWKLYCPSGQGVAIQSTVGRLRALYRDDLVMTVDQVEYRYTNKLGSIEDWVKLPFLKRVAYHFEQEVRVVGRHPLKNYLSVNGGRTGLNLPFDLNKAVTRVWAPAGSPKWHQGTLASLMNSYEIDLMAERSGILDDLWGTRGEKS